MKNKIFALLGIPAALSAGVVLAEDSQSPTIPDAFTSFDWTTLITSMATTVAPVLLAVLGLAAGVYIVRWCWRMLKGTAK